jgi:hypothetical protein
MAPASPREHSTNQRKRVFRIRNFDLCEDSGKLLTLRLRFKQTPYSLRAVRKKIFIIEYRNLSLTGVFQIGNRFYRVSA